MSSVATASRSAVQTSLASAASTQRESDEQLLRRYQGGDMRAREELVHRFLPLTKRLAGRYRHTGESQDDLEQVACMGLIKAVDRYDPDLGPFVRYAVPNIMGELKRHFRDKGWGMHVPRSVQERFLRVNDALDQLSGRLGRSPSPKDIAEHTGFSIEEVLEALDAATAYSPMTLDAPHPGDGDTERTLADSLGAEDPGYGFVDLGQALAPAFRALPPREQLILKLRFIDDYTQSEIADQVGVSQMHVSRLLRRSLDRLNAAADGQVQAND
jgi:RNA polymerase sigma-B factor